jgi:hypothetical protein
MFEPGQSDCKYFLDFQLLRKAMDHTSKVRGVNIFTEESSKLLQPGDLKEFSDNCKKMHSQFFCSIREMVRPGQNGDAGGGVGEEKGPRVHLGCCSFG